MVFHRPVFTTLRCSKCRTSFLNAFVAFVRASPRTLFRPSPFTGHHVARRTFTSTAHRAQNEAQEMDEVVEKLKENGFVPGHAFSEENRTEVSALDEGSASVSSLEDVETTDYVPWYLRVEQETTKQSKTLAERQRIPDLPTDPPPILQTILEHLSNDIGLEDMSLLDLRKIDPPPALGASLIMIIGTARSEKHLHVSADRHCRWLRSTYHLSPFADGLLGRGELKIKLRRKARRAKLLKSVGAPEEESRDDGIRTGWICVNIGRVEAAQGSDERPQIENFVGFGPRSSGVSLVIQMFTEEKRGEIDLETLWMQYLNRATRRIAKINEEGESTEARSAGYEVQDAQLQPEERERQVVTG